MAKCCDRCSAIINPKETCSIKIEVGFREFIKNIVLVINRRMSGIKDYDHYNKIAEAEVDLCDKCRESLMEFLKGAEVVRP